MTEQLLYATKVRAAVQSYARQSEVLTEALGGRELVAAVLGELDGALNREESAHLHSELEHVDLVVLNDTTALFSGNPLTGLMPGGAVFMQSPFTDPAAVWERIPEHHKKFIREKRIRVYFTDMVKIARPVASEADLEMRMQGIVLLGAFLKLTPYATESGMTDEGVYAGVEKALRKYFGKRGDQVVQDNLLCVRRGYSEMKEIPQDLITSA